MALQRFVNKINSCCFSEALLSCANSGKTRKAQRVTKALASAMRVSFDRPSSQLSKSSLLLISAIRPQNLFL
jgi:hypothetical protein